MAFAGDAKARFVDMAHASSSHEFADPRRHDLEFLGLLLAPATTLSGHSLIAPNRSAMVCATRSSGMSC